MSAAERLPNADVPECPVCLGRLDLVYDRFRQRVYVCVDCHAGITIPDTAWEIVRKKRESKEPAKE